MEQDFTSPFALLKLPHDASIHFFTHQEENSLGVVEQSSFVFHPFDENDSPTIRFKKDILKSDFNPIFDLKASENTDTTKDSFIQYIERAKHSFATTPLQKVIASRIKIVNKTNYFNPINYFTSLTKFYPQACVSLVYFNGAIWIGASPELLLKTHSTQIETVALAGTKKIDHSEPFTDKEKQEQKIVTDSICENLKPFSIADSIKISEPLESIAGSLIHLKTHISATLKDKKDIPNLINALHPTPAVGGHPKDMAFDFIQKNEAHKRGYYTGYLGIVNENDTELYVNIRCMKVTHDHLELYVGCGITADSNSELEWLESENKLQTLLSKLE